MKNDTTHRGWVAYLAVPFVVHLVLSALARTDQFAGGPLQHFFVRVGIAVIVTAVIAAVASAIRARTR
ncbi:hypothetical protein [Actinoplanes teichomyceticus]|uniref:Uncharacterized protein n=1 Tax=Actinoplanes teichomyceticus TaxID=1867 RepID=A0A561WKC3_ACTTI|nr:hypothetical protein [Actinoplanes teichomyceticus]TWG24317.1 hypothetical protein FHX34_102870 [Actinoplanes teichomyceticus]GIF12833.1 hypothetical protein Ate01nite_28650 [Actinoplanes teichomyceticus]